MKNNKDATMQFQVTSGRLAISDPCYERDGADTEGVVDIKAANGQWVAKTFPADPRYPHGYIRGFSAKAKGHSIGNTQTVSVYVDSGQMGIYDYDQSADIGVGEYGDLDGWYGRACEANNASNAGGVIDDYGVVCSSGYGDGEYPCLLTFNTEGECIGVSVSFLDEDDDEDGYYCGYGR